MPLYALIAKDKAGGFEHRMAVRPTHLKHLDSLGDTLVFAGPFQDENAQATGSFVVIDAPDLESARTTFGKDPFVSEGVFESYEVTRWSLTINKGAGR